MVRMKLLEQCLEVLSVLIIIHGFVWTKNGDVRVGEYLSQVLDKTQILSDALRKKIQIVIF